jgi:hypothetical protein
MSSAIPRAAAAARWRARAAAWLRAIGRFLIARRAIATAPRRELEMARAADPLPPIFDGSMAPSWAERKE